MAEEAALEVKLCPKAWCTPARTLIQLALANSGSGAVSVVESLDVPGGPTGCLFLVVWALTGRNNT